MAWSAREVDFTATLREYLIDCNRNSSNQCISPWFIRGYADRFIVGSLTVTKPRRVAILPRSLEPATPKVTNADGSITELATWKGSYQIAMDGITEAGAINQVTVNTDFYIPSPSYAGYYDLGNGTFKRYNGKLFLDDSVVITGYTPQSPEPSTCVKDCIFTAYKNGQQVLRKQASSCPLVQCKQQQQCPPNTCDVLCGNTICCYNTDGISVFNYPNT